MKLLSLEIRALGRDMLVISPLPLLEYLPPEPEIGFQPTYYDQSFCMNGPFLISPRLMLPHDKIEHHSFT